MKNRLFFKIFGLMVFGFVLVFLITLIGRMLFFEDIYISRVNNRNIADLNNAAEYVNQGGDIYDYIYQNDLTNISAYIIDDIYDDDDFYPEDIEDIEDIVVDDLMFRDGVYYDVIQIEGSDEFYSIYYTELDDQSILVFEEYFYALSDANATQLTIDLYVIIGLVVFLIPYTYWYTRRFTKPLLAMNKQVESLSNLEFLPPLEIDSTDEIGELASSINKVSVDLEKAINKLKDDIEFEQYKDKKRRELIASLSHELKTPITTLRAVIEGMRDNVGKYQNRDLYLDESLQYLHFMETLSNDLIHTINIESKTITRNEYQLTEIINSSYRFVDNTIQNKSQTIKNDITPCIVECNFDMILRVFINLISNGSKYSEENAEITVSNKVFDEYTEINILNTNAHINEEELEKIFEPFYRIEKSRSKETGGSGLGLFIIKTILDGHGSTYSIKNTDDGVLFTFTLKIHKSDLSLT